MPAGYTPIQRTWAALLSRADDELDDNTSRDITAQIMRELVMDFMYTTEQLGSLSIADTDGDTSIAVEFTDDDDTIRFTSGGVAVGTMSNSGGFPTMSFGGLVFGSGIEMTTNQVRLRSYGSPVARFGDSASAGTGFHLGDLDANFNLVSGGNHLHYDAESSTISTSATQVYIGKVGAYTIVFPGHAEIKSNSSSSAVAQALYLDDLGWLRQGPIAAPEIQSADGSTRISLNNTSDSGNQFRLEINDSTLSGLFTSIIEVDLTASQQASLAGNTGVITNLPALRWGSTGEEVVRIEYEGGTLFEIGEVSNGLGRIVIGDFQGDNELAYISFSDGDNISGLSGSHNIEIASELGIAVVMDGAFAMGFDRVGDAGQEGLRVRIGDYSSANNGTSITINDDTEIITVNKDFYLSSSAYTGAVTGTTTTALTVLPSGQVVVRNISGGGGASVLNELSDVDTTVKTLQQGDVIAYNATSQNWEAQSTVNIYGTVPLVADQTALTTGGNWDGNNVYSGSALSGTYEAGIKWFNATYLYEFDGTNWHRQAKTSGSGGTGSRLQDADNDTYIDVEASTDDDIVRIVAENATLATFGVTASRSDINLGNAADSFVRIAGDGSGNYFQVFQSGTSLFTITSLDAGTPITRIESNSVVFGGSDIDFTGHASIKGGAATSEALYLDGTGNLVQGTITASGGASETNDLTDSYADYTNTLIGIATGGQEPDWADLLANGRSRIMAVGYAALNNLDHTNASSQLALEVVAVGHFAGDGLAGGYRSSIFGPRAGIGATMAESTAIGWEAGSNGNLTQSIVLGNRAGRTETVTNTFLAARGTGFANEFLRISHAATNIVQVPLLPAFADETAATTGGLTQGMLYYNSTSSSVDQVRS